jgi:GT2 family glycosyltransferase
MNPSEEKDPDKSKKLHKNEQVINNRREQHGERDRVISEKGATFHGILNSTRWRVMRRIQAIRFYLVSRTSYRVQWIYSVGRGLRLLRRQGVIAFIHRMSEKVSYRLRRFSLRLNRHHARSTGVFFIEAERTIPPVQPHQASVDIIVCVHDALTDVQRCLESIVRYATPPYSLILVDDGSTQPTQEYLDDFALSQAVLLIRNEQARGYTRAANQGLHASSANYVILLNSDTMVTPLWLDRLVACGESDPHIGLVGPLSNTASWQSIPKIYNAEGDWAENPLPEGFGVAEMGQLVATYSGRVYPHISFLNGFCLMIKRGLIDQIGYLDEERFGEGYGEENDYCLRAAKAGWQLAVADDTYIYHAQSRSYSHERRKQLVDRSNKAFGDKYGHQIISDGIQHSRFDHAMQGCRARNQVMLLRQQTIVKAKERWEGKRIAFYLPISEPSGGGHVVLQEAESMQKMGISVEILNLDGHQPFFEHAYPNLTIPTVYIQDPSRSANLLSEYDAVIGTMYNSISWLKLPETSHIPVRGYYIQDFEPGFFPPETKAHKQAIESYTLFPNLVRFTKTEWNRQAVLQNIGVDCHIVGPSVDIDTFRPRPRKDPDWPARPLRVAAMIRPSTPRRQPALTMQALHQISHRNSDVEIILFGCDLNDPGFSKLERDFPWQLAGILTRPQLVALLNEVDIFVDFSAYQAMGLTAMEAMACGAAVIVPQFGGATSFTQHEKNALVIETDSLEPCVAAVDRLIRDEQLRTSIQQQSIFDICQHFPENAAYNILEILFP